MDPRTDPEISALSSLSNSRGLHSLTCQRLRRTQIPYCVRISNIRSKTKACREFTTRFSGAVTCSQQQTCRLAWTVWKCKWLRLGDLLPAKSAAFRGVSCVETSKLLVFQVFLVHFWGSQNFSCSQFAFILQLLYWPMAMYSWSDIPNIFYNVTVLSERCLSKKYLHIA